MNTKPDKYEIIIAKLEAERFFRDTYQACAKLAVERMWNNESMENPLDHMAQAFEDVVNALVEHGVLGEDDLLDTDEDAEENDNGLN